MKGFLLDANVLVRFLVQDEPRQSRAATAVFEKAERGEIRLHLDALVVAEAVYALTRRYGKSRADVAGALLSVIQNSGIETMGMEVVSDALQRFGVVNADFVDAWLAAMAAQKGMAVASFDHDLDKFKDIRRFEPRV